MASSGAQNSAGRDFQSSSRNVPLADFLGTLKRAGFPIKEALPLVRKLATAGFASEVALAKVTDGELKQAGITEDADRKVLLAIGKRIKQPSSFKNRGKRARDSDLDRPLPTKEEDLEDQPQIDFQFHEVKDESLLEKASVVINRAPVMAAWATVVAERQGFGREEALSVAHTFTEMNAKSKGFALGIYDESKQNHSIGPTQPYVDLMGRKVPVLSMQDGQWRGLVDGGAADPKKAFGYISRSFRQQLSVTMGVLKLLADSFSPEELNSKGYGLYSAFRPESAKWGAKSEMRLSTILGLRRHLTHDNSKSEDVTSGSAAKDRLATATDGTDAQTIDPEPPAKRTKTEGHLEDEIWDEEWGKTVDWDAIGA